MRRRAAGSVVQAAARARSAAAATRPSRAPTINRTTDRVPPRRNRRERTHPAKRSHIPQSPHPPQPARFTRLIRELVGVSVGVLAHEVPDQPGPA
ncbi:hypothetical protein Phou_072100 [Phytohabitans houttuyneae]|uniref:Uncharacterized protein n=1 Tax=Phytohabitans houttuyneae TaxID=1076126 RepID=A0A6V8KHY7_9ACTN|nr:hypothetical protein Phou_072100 [Phytohabitans houttuyneae]